MPRGRRYLPYRLTKAEKRSPARRKKLASCIKSVEKTACPPSVLKRKKIDYAKCSANPVAVCRASLK